MWMKEENLWEPLETSKEQAQGLLETVDRQQGSVFKEDDGDCFSLEGDARVQMSQVQTQYNHLRHIINKLNNQR